MAVVTTCPSCGRFFNLKHNPVKCPHCGRIHRFN